MKEPNAAPFSSAAFSRNAVWAFRGLSTLALLPLVIAECVDFQVRLHAGLIGFTTGILIVMVAMSFCSKRVTLRSQRSRNDVQNNRIRG